MLDEIYYRTQSSSNLDNIMQLRPSGAAGFLYFTSLKNSTDDYRYTTGGFLPHMLFRGFTNNSLPD
jgi:hypothetical protein